MKTISKIMALIIFISIFTACSNDKGHNVVTNDSTIPVSIVELNKNDVVRNINATGKFTTDDETYLSFKTGGVVRSVFVSEGDAVRKGQLLATLDVNEIQSQVNQAQAAFDKAERDYKRVQNLFKDSVATSVQLQDAKTGFDLATQQLKIAKFNLNYSEIRAVQDGFVLKKFVNSGQIVAPGTPIVLTNGAKSKNWILRVAVADNDRAAISKGDIANVTFDGGDKQIYEAKVTNLSEGIDPFSGTFTIDLTLKTKPQTIAAGMFGKAEIHPKKTVSSWLVPTEAIIDGDANSGYVFITLDKKTAKKVKISLGELIGDKVMVKNGLENAKYLVTTGSAYLNDNSSITINK